MRVLKYILFTSVYHLKFICTSVECRLVLMSNFMNSFSICYIQMQNVDDFVAVHFCILLLFTLSTFIKVNALLHQFNKFYINSVCCVNNYKKVILNTFKRKKLNENTFDINQLVIRSNHHYLIFFLLPESILLYM